MKIEISDLRFSRMECRANEGLAILDSIQAEGRVRTKTEDRKLRLLKIQQEIDRSRWAEQRAAEGHPVCRKLFAPSGSSASLRVNNSGARPAIYVYGDIGSDFGGITAQEFQRQLSSIPDGVEIDLHVNSDGGSFLDGLAMRSLVASRSGRVNGFVDGRAFSAASVLLMGCDKIVMARGSLLMIHGAHIPTGGTASDLETKLDLVRNANEELFQCYRPRWTGSDKELRSALESERYMTAADAQLWGLCDEISEGMALAAHAGSRVQHKSIPPTLAIAAHGAYTPGADRMELRLHRAICV